MTTASGPASPMPTMKRYPWRFAAGIAISSVLVVLLLNEVGFAELGRTIISADRPSLLLFLMTSLLMLVGRVLRYRLLLDQPVGLWPLTLVTLARGLFVDLLPARIGSLSYVYLLRYHARVPVDDALASFFIAFLFDVLSIAPLVLLAVLVVQTDTAIGVAGLVAFSILLLVLATVALLALGPVLGTLSGWLRGIAKRLRPGRPGQWLRLCGETLSTTDTRVQQVRKRGVLAPVLGLSLAIRLTKYAAFYFLLQAVLMPHGLARGSLDVFRVFLGVAGAELSASLPIHGIAGFGTYEATWALTLSHLGMTWELAILSGFATHIISQAHDYGLGILALLWLMRPRGSSDGHKAPPADHCRRA